MTTLILADLPPIEWHYTEQEIMCSRGGISASVEAPIRGQYTDDRTWEALVSLSKSVARNRLAVKEFKAKV